MHEVIQSDGLLASSQARRAPMCIGSLHKLKRLDPLSTRPY